MRDGGDWDRSRGIGAVLSISAILLPCVDALETRSEAWPLVPVFVMLPMATSSLVLVLGNGCWCGWVGGGEGGGGGWAVAPVPVMSAAWPPVGAELELELIRGD